MNTIRKGSIISLVALLTLTILPVAALAQFDSLDAVAGHYLQKRPEMAPLIPPLQPSILDTLEEMIIKGDYSFQDWNGWYAGWSDGYCTATDELAAYDGQTLIVYEDLSTAAIKIVTEDGKLVAAFKSEPFPNLSTLSSEAYNRVLLDELNLRSLVLWISFDNNSTESTSASASSLSGSSGGGIMMSMGGSNEFEVIEIKKTNSAMAVTFAWPATFSNRFDIYSFDGGAFTGRVSWELADVGYVSSGTNQLRWVDSGQLGRALSSNTSVRFYAAGISADVDSDGDGYGDSYEYLVLHTATNDPDTDNDNISDGPFDPDNTGPITAGPDAFPLDPYEWLDTDGDGIGDNTDTDDDGDGKLDSAETNALERLMPITTAPFRVVTVENTDPAGDDSGTEVFDVSSAGRMLPYATGGDARGQGWIHGGIYFNNDGTNLYVGVAGLEKDGVNSLMIFLDTDGTSGGAYSLAGISGNPSAFGQANNLSFSATLFTPNVGILVGNRFVDGKNNSTSMGLGQGVYALTQTTVSDFSGFSSSSGAISQWGDRGTDSANAGIEIALSLSSLGLSTGQTFKAAAIINGGTMGSYNRWFSGECYGESASGTMAGNNFEDNAITLIGAEVFLSTTPAPESSDPPPFTEDDVMLQGYYWNLPGIFKSMTVAGISNNWDASQNNMTLINESEWEYIHDFTPSTSGVEFKFTANGNWGINWGDDNQSATNLPITYKQASQGSSYNIAIPGTVSGYIRFRFNTSSSRYSIEQVASGNTTEVSNNSTNFWYKNLSAKTQNGDLDRFTMIWMPPPQKSSSGLQSVGYDPFDYYDLGTYNEKGSVETRYGSEAQLNTCIDSLRSRRIQPIIDLVLNHNQNGESGTNQFKFAFANHNTFEKLDPSGNNSNDYFNASLANQPFHHEYDFGRDVNFEHPYQRQGLKAWGDWVTAKAAYQGYRWDVAYNIDPWFISEFMNDGLKKGRFSVLEFWEKESEGTTGEIETYLALTDYRSAMFDMPLRHSLEDLCENPGADFDISTLAEKGLVNHAPQWAVTFAESHDTIRPYGPENPPKVGIIKDKMMAYAFVLISEGLPMISYNDYFIGWKADQSPPDDSVDDGWTGGTLKTEIDKLIDIRRQFTGGDTTYLNSDSDLLIMKRSGGNKPGCILTLNDDDDYTKSASVNTGWPEDTVLADALATNHTVTVLSGGMATLEAPSRGYRIYVNQDDL